MSQQAQYCRFCAEQKTDSEITNLTTNVEIRKDIIEKVTVCNLSCVDFSDKTLPETICIPCLSSLNLLVEFIRKLNSSQVILNDICKVYKSENEYIPDHIDNDSYYNTDIESTIKQDCIYDSAQALVTEVPIGLVKCDFDGGMIKTNLPDVYAWSSYPWACKHCHLSLESMEAVRRHSRKAHGTCYGFQCADCDEVHNVFDFFVEHVRQHRAGLRFFCEYCNIKLENVTDPVHIHEFTANCCGEVFPDEQHLHHHTKKHQSRIGEMKKKLSKKKISALKELLSYGVEVYNSNCPETWKDYPCVCKHCSTKFPDQDTLRSHVKEVHGKCFGLKCVDCVKNFDSFEAFVEHVKAHRPSLMYYCQYCNCRLEDAQADIIHISEHLANDLLCQTCGHIFENETELQKHVSVYNPSKSKRPFKRKDRPVTVDELTCDICQKVSKSLNILRAHKKLHTDRRKDYTCDRCGMAFFTKGALLAHNLIHEKPEPQVCLICKKSFLTLTRLKKHLKTHDAIKPFQCSQCQRCFRLKEQLKGHYITHTDLLPYKCQYCEKAFKHKNVLKIHETQHTGARPYSCELCKMDFTNWSNCNKHMKRKHGATLAKSVMTPQGKLPLNPKTGKPRKLGDLETVKEWAQQILEPLKRGKKNTVEAKI